MKRYFTLFLLFAGLSANAQILIGSNEIPTLNSPGHISKSRLAEFKKTTTIFTLQ